MINELVEIVDRLEAPGKKSFSLGTLRVNLRIYHHLFFKENKGLTELEKRVKEIVTVYWF
jgi:hypothetical protein